MNIPVRATHCVGDEARFRFAYSRPDSRFWDRWTAFDGNLLACAPSGQTFVMHYECCPETRQEISRRMRADARLNDGQRRRLFQTPSHYVIEQNVPLQDVTTGRFNFGLWWNVSVCSNYDALLTTMAGGSNPELVLHDGDTNGGLLFLLFRNFYADEVSIRSMDAGSSDRIFELAARHCIPMAEVGELDFYEGTM